ncbi:MAG: sulfurtransferase complex subunit TusD [Pseudomonadales bacterium]
MIFSLLIYASPNTQSEQSALRFSRAAIAQGHQLHRVFFYGDSVNAASNNTVTPRDEVDITDDWLALMAQPKIDLVVCIAAAVRRGLLDAQEAQRHQKPAINLRQGFALSGLGQLADAIINSNQLITFGN